MTKNQNVYLISPLPSSHTPAHSRAMQQRIVYGSAAEREVACFTAMRTIMEMLASGSLLTPNEYTVYGSCSMNLTILFNHSLKLKPSDVDVLIHIQSVESFDTLGYTLLSAIIRECGLGVPVTASTAPSFGGVGRRFSIFVCGEKAADLVHEPGARTFPAIPIKYLIANAFGPEYAGMPEVAAADAYMHGRRVPIMCVCPDYTATMMLQVASDPTNWRCRRDGAMLNLLWTYEQYELISSKDDGTCRWTRRIASRATNTRALDVREQRHAFAMLVDAQVRECSAQHVAGLSGAVCDQVRRVDRCQAMVAQLAKHVAARAGERADREHSARRELESQIGAMTQAKLVLAEENRLMQERLSRKTADLEASRSLLDVTRRELGLVLEELDFLHDGDLLCGRLLDSVERSSHLTPEVGEKFRQMLTVPGVQSRSPKSVPALQTADVCAALVAAGVEVWQRQIGNQFASRSAMFSWAQFVATGQAREFVFVVETVRIVYACLQQMRAETITSLQTLADILKIGSQPSKARRRKS